MSVFLTRYEYLTFDNPVVTLRMIIWGVYAGILIGCIAAWYTRVYVGRAVRGLLSAEAYSPETAKTLSDVGIRPNFIFSRNMADGKTPRKYINVANPEETEITGKKSRIRRFFTGNEYPPKKYDLKTAKFYIPEKVKDTAFVRYDKKGSSAKLLIIAAVVFFALALAVSYYAPRLLTMLDETIGTIVGSE